uniref:Four and a half LIM domains protein 2-like n=1 Tax=Takifugu rubripes TaxID=31033 RepID=H2T959_TAKRU
MSECLDCAECKASLYGQKYILKEENMYCIGCYEALFSTTCEVCQLLISCTSKDLSYNDRHWHSECFLCLKCSRSLVDRPFATKDDMLMCVECYSNEYSAKCHACMKTIMPGGVNYRDQPWHKECFTCIGCKGQLVGQRFTSRNDFIYCLNCFCNLFAKKCASCACPISLGGSKYISFEHRQWHNDCFNCKRCSVSLVGRGFLTSKDDILCPDCGKEV